MNLIVALLLLLLALTSALSAGLELEVSSQRLSRDLASFLGR